MPRYEARITLAVEFEAADENEAEEMADALALNLGYYCEREDYTVTDDPCVEDLYSVEEDDEEVYDEEEAWLYAD